MDGLIIVYYVFGIVASAVVIVSALWKLRKPIQRLFKSLTEWFRNLTELDEKEEQIVCDSCERKFTPEWDERTGLLGNEEVAICPHCGEEYSREVDEESEEED